MLETRMKHRSGSCPTIVHADQRGKDTHQHDGNLRAQPLAIGTARPERRAVARRLCLGSATRRCPGEMWCILGSLPFLHPPPPPASRLRLEAVLPLGGGEGEESCAFRSARRQMFAQAIALTQHYTPMAVNVLAKVMTDPPSASPSKVAAAAARWARVA